MPVITRFATAKDATLIADMSRTTFYETFASQNTKENIDKFMNGQFTREALIEEVNDPAAVFLIAAEEDLPVGYAKMSVSKNPSGLENSAVIEIARLYATTGAIGKGAGKALMQKCIEVAAEKKKEAIWLGVWEQNHRAIAFYTKWGFEKFGTQLFLLGDDPQKDWLMKKML